MIVTGRGDPSRLRINNHFNRPRRAEDYAEMARCDQHALRAQPVPVPGHDVGQVNVNRGEHINFADHSLYYDEKTQSESLYSLSSIVVGNGHLLGQEGMLAEPRHTVHEQGMDDSGGIDWVADGEGDRTPTSDHDHANDPESVTP